MHRKLTKSIVTLHNSNDLFERFHKLSPKYLPNCMARILLIFSLFFVVHMVTSDPKLPLITICQIGVTSNSTAATITERNDNLTSFLWNISSQAQLVRFYNATSGDIPNKVYAVFQCRYDLSLYNCGNCVSDAIMVLESSCVLFEDGVAYYEECMLRYAYHDIFAFNDTTAYMDSYLSNSCITASNFFDFNQLLRKAIDEVVKAAAKGIDGIYFASSETNITSSEKLYCLAQCSPNMDSSQCIDCLQGAFSDFRNFSYGCISAVAMYPSCQLKYDNKSFLFIEDSAAPSPSSLMSPLANQGHGAVPTNHEEPSMKPAIIVGITAAASIGLVLFIAGLWLFLRKRPRESFDQMPEAIDKLRHGAMENIDSLESLQFDFKGVQAATCNFSEENKLGQGGFGEVYKGNFSNGEEIAVKRLSKNSQQGDSEFTNEVVLLAKLQHKNLVKLLGFCISNDEKILIYEFLSNSSLDRFLYDPVMRASLEWELRFKIISGISRGLLYLHEDSRLKIIHRDLKTSNILLDDAMSAKIADFGLARLFGSDQTRGNTMRVAGTYGYMAPEYVLAGHFSAKSDVYSFGVIVLEIVSGQRNDFFQQEPNEGLLYRAWRFWNEDASLKLVDPLLSNKFSEEEAKLCIQIGLLCVQEDAAHRPRMASVVPALNGESITLPLPKAPHIFTISPETDAAISFNLIEIEIDDAYTGTTNITDLYPR